MNQAAFLGNGLANNYRSQADLGTARREHVSTVDDAKNISHARLADIEATRKSNIPGTDAARLAKKDEARLSAWSSTCLIKQFPLLSLAEMIF